MNTNSGIPSQDDFNNDLAELVRKSWSEPQDTPSQPQDVGSPIETIETIEEENEHEQVVAQEKLPKELYTKEEEEVKALQEKTFVPIEEAKTGEIEEGYNYAFLNNANQKSSDYQLFKRHYNLTDESSNAITDILDDLDLSGSPEPSRLEAPLNPPVILDNNSQMPLRRSSLQEVQWVRQLLNPRSSFSGFSTNEQIPDNNCDKSWITILDNDDPESIKSIVVLHQSLNQVGTKYGLCVLYSGNMDISLLKNLGIKTIQVGESVMKFLSVDGYSISSSLSKLFLFMTLMNIYELVCYLSPTCMVLENIDELLSSSEVCNEIDNETCVLLTNDGNISDDEILIIITRPNNEVAMCIQEYFTVYGDNIEQRNKKLEEMKDVQILRELFGETWAHLSSEGYCQTLKLDSTREDVNCKIVDYKLLKPWNIDVNTKMNILHNPLYGSWYHAWHNAIKR
ncbi:hypothetical protein Kpol_2001p12 [Vanderwaltozyma polyspora DSM 70294]|uniref:Uncharacterized protein n=1 Tax=Vanderwaltozyma polyspora (strain ATCC 22028 / DSM 70294 / BCRC 21397 / CBS 2163 / NBRC 10782 / NRRL Y-8283 / UCD 57-17) TaxID=436907 RepID=A7TGP8_VANPO|nr:uncharacterized protein Kpol_2001p12 [Vanderwaltozyma polyspora DSM 70294]EDO18511.1 hypothetical protein Kpol_2001p12 [Vanderwaltozyma polyspora DSM 70294]